MTTRQLSERAQLACDNFQANLVRQFGKQAGDRRYDRTMTGWDAATIAAHDHFTVATQEWHDRIVSNRAQQSGAISLPLLAFQAAAGIGIASGVLAVVNWAQAAIGGAL